MHEEQEGLMVELHFHPTVPDPFIVHRVADPAAYGRACSLATMQRINHALTITIWGIFLGSVHSGPVGPERFKHGQGIVLMWKLI